MRSASMPKTLCVPTFSGRAQGCLPARTRARSQRHQPAGQRRRQQRGELGHAGLEVVVDLQQVVVAGLDFALDALPARGAALEVGDPHDVVERHPQRQPARHLARGGEAVRARGVGGALGRAAPAAGAAGRARRRPGPGTRACGHGRGRACRARSGGKAPACHCGLDPQSMPARASVAAPASPVRARPARRSPACARACAHDARRPARSRAGWPPPPLPPRPHHRFVVLAREREQPAAGDRAQHHGADDRAGLLARPRPCRTRGARG